MPAEKERILVTGSSGLIGSAVVRRFSRSHEVIGFDEEGPPDPPGGADAISVDLKSDESVKKAFLELRERHGARIASVIHLAAYYDFSGEPSPLYEEVTVQGTERVLRELRSFEVGQFVFSSTMLVHAPRDPGHRIDEEDDLDPRWDYPKSKLATERLIRELPARFRSS